MDKENKIHNFNIQPTPKTWKKKLKDIVRITIYLSGIMFLGGMIVIFLFRMTANPFNYSEIPKLIYGIIGTAALIYIFSEK